MKKRIFEAQDVVLASDCDAESKLSVLGAVCKIQNNVCDFFYSVGIDGLTLKKKINASWMFTKNKIKFILPLKWNEKFKVNCFISKISMATMYVDTILYKQSGEIAVYSKTEVCLVDLSSNSIKRIKDIGLDENYEIIDSKMEVDFDRFNQIEEGTEIDKIKVRSTSIDYLHHTNNTEYVRFVMNTYSSSEQITCPIREFEIHYVGQAKENDLLTIYRKTSENIDYVTIKNEDKTDVRCKITKGEKHD